MDRGHDPNDRKESSCSSLKGTGSYKNMNRNELTRISRFPEFLDSDLSAIIEKAHAEQEMRNRKRILENHKSEYLWWQGKTNGYYYTFLPDGKGGKLRKRKKDERALEDMVYQYYREQEEAPTFRDLFYEQYDGKLQSGEIKRQSYTRYENAFLDAYEGTEIEHMKMQDLTEKQLTRFITNLYASRKMDLKAYNMLKTITLGILKKAKSYGLIDFSPTYFFSDLDINPKRKTKPDKTREVYKVSEVEKIKEIVDKKMDARSLGCFIIAKTGIRVGEAAALKVEDIDFEKKAIHIHRTEIQYKDQESRQYINCVQDMPKTGESNRWVAVDDKTLPYLRELVKLSFDSEYLISEDGVRIKSKGLRNKLRRICWEAGIAYRPPHKLRKTVASMLDKNGVSSEMIKSQMGHTSFKTTEQFYLYDMSEIEERQKAIAKAMAY